MTITTFQKLLSELLAQYNNEAENHYIDSIDLTPARPNTYNPNTYAKPIYYTIEIKTTGK